VLLKLCYLILFWSIDVVLYLRLRTQVLKSNASLIVAFTIWLIVLIIHLPTFKLTMLMSINDYLTLSAMIVQLLVAYYLGNFIMNKMRRPYFPDEVKDFTTGFQTLVFGKIIFGFFLFGHFIYVLALRI
jgi:hypothetical protein